MIIYEFDIGILIVGVIYKGEIEEWLKGIIKELLVYGNVIFFIDEIYMLIDFKLGNSGVVSILKLEFVKGNIMVIGVIMVDEYCKLIELDYVFNWCFEVL